MNHYVYLITDGSGFCKIGVSTRLEIRIPTLQTGNPRRLKFINLWTFADRNEAHLIERLIFHASRNSRGIGEWIESSPDALLRLIEIITLKVRDKKISSNHFNCRYVRNYQNISSLGDIR